MQSSTRHASFNYSEHTLSDYMPFNKLAACSFSSSQAHGFHRCQPMAASRALKAAVLGSPHDAVKQVRTGLARANCNSTSTDAAGDSTVISAAARQFLVAVPQLGNPYWEIHKAQKLRRTPLQNSQVMYNILCQEY